jgi:tRNA 2-thiouridine synthesizing protein D
MMADSILVLITKPPYGLEDAFAGLRLALAMAVNGMRTTVVLMDDGAYGALKTQRPEAVAMPSNMEATKELYDFDVKVHVAKEDLESRGIDESQLFEGLEVLPADGLKNLIQQHDVVTTF